MINLSAVILNPDTAQKFYVYRSSGQFVNGRWTENEPTIIPITGVVSVISQKELNALPEGDRIVGAMVFHSIVEIRTTSKDNQGTSDKILWNNEYYRIFNVWPYKDYGFWKAVGERIKGS
jgi:hypothetical protein